jgi:HD-GYP domain-containing protein (c-di-GMP phosphodiesterase class II)
MEEDPLTTWLLAPPGGRHQETFEEADEHGVSVARLAVAIGAELGYSDRHLDQLHLAALAHDVGKTQIKQEILDKPGPLTRGEWSQIRLHPVLGEQILIADGLPDVAAWVRSHHEHFDGGGYPDGLSGLAIPEEARILAVADAYDAMLSERPYSAAITPASARAELRREAGRQFDPQMVAAALRCTQRFDSYAGTELVAG